MKELDMHENKDPRKARNYAHHVVERFMNIYGLRKIRKETKPQSLSHEGLEERVREFLGNVAKVVQALQSWNEQILKELSKTSDFVAAHLDELLAKLVEIIGSA